MKGVLVCLGVWVCGRLGDRLPDSYARAYSPTPPSTHPLILTLFALLLLTALPAAAQHRTAVEAVRPEMHTRVLTTDTSMALRTRAVARGRVDVQSGVRRASYRIEAAPHGGPPTDAARTYLREQATAYGWPGDTGDLALDTVRQTPYGSHVTFQQTLGGVPVHDRMVKVNLDGRGRPTMVLSSYAPHLARYANAFETAPALTAEDAAARARGLFTVSDVHVRTSALVVYPSDPPRLAWRLSVYTPAAPGDWEVLLDARTGEVIHLIDRAIYDHLDATVNGRDTSPVSASPPRRLAASQPPSLSASPLLRRTASPSPRLSASQTNGSGYVFDPDPLTTAGAEYGDIGFTDDDDAASPELDAQLQPVTLRDITQGADGLYRLQGPYVHITGQRIGFSTQSYVPPAETSPDAFTYTRSHDGFEAVMAYYHIDKSQRYVQSLDVGRAVQEVPIRVNPQGRSSDDSGYTASDNALVFGTGGVDDAEDADVLWHEYAHALLEDSAPRLTTSVEGRAFHEGWSDYWAASYSRAYIEAGDVPNRDWRRVFDWDGNNESLNWYGRVLDAHGVYPMDVHCADGSCSERHWYQDGAFWATALMDVYSALGRTVTDRLHVVALAYLNAPTTFRDAAEAIVQADMDIYGGTHVQTLLEVLEPWGLLEPDTYGPVLVHDPLRATEQLGGTAQITATVRSTSAGTDVAEVRVVFSTGATPEDTLALHHAGDDRYVVDLPLPTSPDTVSYYVEAVDVHGRRTRQPAGAPDERFHVAVGPDHEPPVVRHTPRDEMPLTMWPADLEVEAEDDLAVDSVWAEYELLDPAGTLQSTNRVGLARTSGSIFRATFPIPLSALQHASTVRYRVHARDASAAANETILPESGWYTFTVTADGVLLAYDFESADDLMVTGAWARGEPSYGLRTAQSGRYVWAVSPDAAYPTAVRRSSLELPPLNLQNLDQAYLSFWHWYDTEWDDGTLWDGGNVKVSTDGGDTYDIVTPQDGYPGTLSDASTNPMGGERAFGGYSYGWRHVVVPLPDSADVRIRFDFGTDHDSTGTTVFNRAGWHLDDVRISTELPEDDAPPHVTSPPPTVQRFNPQLTTNLAIEVGDDGGVTDVYAEYEGFDEGTVRLGMHPANRNLYEGAVTLPRMPSYRDSLTYRLRIRDAGGHTTVYPEPDADPLVVRFRRLAEHDLLAEARGNGLWTASAPGWTTTGDTPRAPVSSLVLAPVTLPSNSEVLELVLDHRHALGSGFAGNIKLSTDQGDTWQLLMPVDGYDAEYDAGDPAHPMHEQGVFRGGQGERRTARFDLAAHAEQRVQLRFDLATPRAPTAGEGWTIEHTGLALATSDEQFEAPLRFRLDAPYPNPARGNATLHYTLPEIGDGRSAFDVRMEVYDVLGRRIGVPIDKRQAPGTHTVTLDAGGWAAGTYFVRLTAAGHAATTRLVIVR